MDPRKLAFILLDESYREDLLFCARHSERNVQCRFSLVVVVNAFPVKIPKCGHGHPLAMLQFSPAIDRLCFLSAPHVPFVLAEVANRIRPSR